jgi:hypothetical protein
MIPFRPVIEPDHPGAFLAEDPIISVHKGDMADIPWMTGVTSEEGTLKVAGRAKYGGVSRSGSQGRKPESAGAFKHKIICRKEKDVSRRNLFANRASSQLPVRELFT